MRQPLAIITGISGQDGTYLAHDLLKLGYRVFGISSKFSSGSHWRFERMGISDHPSLTVAKLDITNPDQTLGLISELKPREFYNLASHSFVSDSLLTARETSQVSAFAVVNILEAIHLASPRTKFFQASSSEMFGNAQSSPQHENSSFRPRNVYGSAKVFAHYLTQNYRDHRDLFAASGILYNHESPLRGDEFVTRKITKAVAKVKLGITDRLSVGNLSAKRDWGYAPEYVEAMRLILNHEQPDTFVISSGTATTVREFILSAFNSIDVELEFEGEGLSEVGLEKKSGQILVSIDKQFYREPEPITLVGDPGKANRALNWKARTSVSEIAKIMVESELQTMRQI